MNMTCPCIRYQNIAIKLCSLVMGIGLISLVSLGKIDLYQPLRPKGNNELRGSTDTVASDPSYEGEVVWWRELLCGERARPDTKDIQDPVVLKQLLRDIEPDVKDTNVFLTETSCNTNPLYRNWCSVESWAKQNPEMKVWFVLTSVTIDNADSLHRDLLRGYSNLQIVGAHLDNIFAATPANEFFKSGNWTQNMEWVVITVSDMLRTALVWLWGGFYSDTDMMCLTNMKNFTNAIGVEGGHVVNSAFFTMQHHSPYLGHILEKMTIYFHPKWWASISVAGYTQQMRKECAKDNIKMDEQKLPMICRNITVYPPKDFYPLLYDKIPQIFGEGTGKDISKIFNGSSLFHVWNKLSSGDVIRAKSESIYEVVTKRVCPITYKHAVRHSRFF